jgi:hypothetical protein
MKRFPQNPKRFIVMGALLSGSCTFAPKTFYRPGFCAQRSTVLGFLRKPAAVKRLPNAHAKRLCTGKNVLPFRVNNPDVLPSWVRLRKPTTSERLKNVVLLKKYFCTRQKTFHRAGFRSTKHRPKDRFWATTRRWNVSKK